MFRKKTEEGNSQCFKIEVNKVFIINNIANDSLLHTMSIEKQHLKRISKIGAQHTKPKINKILPDPSKNEEHVSSDDSRGMNNL